jgi:hypothetical protein
VGHLPVIQHIATGVDEEKPHEGQNKEEEFETAIIPGHTRPHARENNRKQEKMRPGFEKKELNRFG